MFFSVLLLASALAPAAATGPQPEVACPSCDDHSVCTIDSCDTTTGFCRHDPIVCNDGNPCTADSCNAFIGCQFVARPVGTACDDANPCSAADSCTGTPRVCTGSLLAPGTSCDDSNACTQSESCTAEGQCLGTVLSPGSGCDDQNACTSADSCVESPAGSGNVTCEGTVQPCDDGDPCTQDACDPASGICGTAPQNCNDGNVCTLDACNVAAGGCVHTAQSGSCEDGIFCSVSDFCSSGNCQGNAGRDCRDSLNCTDDRCIQNPNGSGFCQNTPNNFLCPPSTACLNISCQPFGPAPSGCISVPLTGNPCSDNNSCTTGDVCNNQGLCQGTPINCNDGNACTADSCTGGSCAHSNISCNDANACTIDTCVPATGCVHQPSTDPCNDGDICTTNDTCSNGSCQGQPSTDPCNDGNVCTANDTCNNGICQGQQLTGPCDDGNACTTGETCLAGGCRGGVPVDCTDFNVCTHDLCNTASGCYHFAIICDDGNACTLDTCDPATGCAHQPATGGQVTCGVGACQRTVQACVNGVPQTCVPGTPSPEACNNSIDDDCDGSVDEGCNLITVNCVPNPATLNLSAQGGVIVMTCQFPISGSAASQVYVSRLDSADTSSDDVILPDPSTLPCPDPVLGTLYERGISENMAIRGVSDPSVAFKFNLPSDGDCSTLDGDRQDFSARLSAIPDNTNATVCIAGTLDGQNFEACMLMKVLNKGPR